MKEGEEVVIGPGYLLVEGGGNFLAVEAAVKWCSVSAVHFCGFNSL